MSANFSTNRCKVLSHHKYEEDGFSNTQGILYLLQTRITRIVISRHAFPVSIRCRSRSDKCWGIPRGWAWLRSAFPPRDCAREKLEHGVALMAAMMRPSRASLQNRRRNDGCRRSPSCPNLMSNSFARTPLRLICLDTAPDPENKSAT